MGEDGELILKSSSSQFVLRVTESLDRFTESVTRFGVLSSVSNLQTQIDKLRADILADFTMEENVESDASGCDVNTDVVESEVGKELVKARERFKALEAEVVQSKHERETIITESADKLAQATDQISHLEGRIRELVDRENQLNAELDRTRLADHQRTLEQNQQIVALRTEVDAMRKNEVVLRESLNEMSVRCEERLSEAKAENLEAVGQLSSMLQDNQTELLNILTELNTARRRLEITDGKLDERSAQLEDALQRIKLVEQSTDEIRQRNGDLCKQIGELRSERDSLSARIAGYEHAAVDGVVGAEELIRQTSDLEKHLAEKDGTIVQLELVVDDLKETVKNSEGREEALRAENDRLRQQLESATTDQLQMMAGLHSKVQIFEQVIGQRDKEILNLRSELASRKETGGNSQLSSSSFGKIVAASVEPDPDRRLSRLQDIFRQMNADHAEEVSSLTKQLEQGGEHMQLFKEHAKKQFEEQQDKVWMAFYLTLFCLGVAYMHLCHYCSMWSWCGLVVNVVCPIHVVALCWAWLVPGWITVSELVNYLGI